MDYIGSKRNLNEWIFHNIFKYINYEDKRNLTFLDACAGSCSVTAYAANLGFNVISNDIMTYSSYIAMGMTSLKKSDIFTIVEKIRMLNDVEPIEGYIYNTYSENSNRLYFTNDNAKKIDAIRIKIEEENNIIIKSYLIYSLLEAVSRVSNTAGTYGAFLKQIKQRAKEPIELRVENFIFNANVSTFNNDILSLLFSLRMKNKINEDILYIDPPYNERQYCHYYHMYETISLYDLPEVKGVTGMRYQPEKRSKFCSKKDFIDYLQKIINLTSAKIILMSYNSDGLLSKDDILNSITNDSIQCDCIEKLYKRYKSDNERHKDESDLFEYLFVFMKNVNDKEQNFNMVVDTIL